LSILRKYIEKIQVPVKSDRNNGYFNKDLWAFMLVSRSVLLRMRNISEKKVVEKIKTHILYSIAFSEYRAMYEITRRNMVGPEMPQMTVSYGVCALHAG
jgi:hypothetical protein